MKLSSFEKEHENKLIIINLEKSRVKKSWLVILIKGESGSGFVKLMYKKA